MRRPDRARSNHRRTPRAVRRARRLRAPWRRSCRTFGTCRGRPVPSHGIRRAGRGCRSSAPRRRRPVARRRVRVEVRGRDHQRASSCLRLRGGKDALTVLRAHADIDDERPLVSRGRSDIGNEWHPPVGMTNTPSAISVIPLATTSGGGGPSTVSLMVEESDMPQTEGNRRLRLGRSAEIPTGTSVAWTRMRRIGSRERRLRPGSRNSSASGSRRRRSWRPVAPGRTTSSPFATGA